MDDTDRLAHRFEEHRPRLTALANRMLGSAEEADDAVQETWLRLNRTGGDSIENLGGWLTTVVSRVCLNVLQARRSRPEVPLDADLDLPEEDAGPQDQALLADSIGLALLVVLDTLSPAERVAFVLHDLFGVSFEEIGPIVGRNTTAARQLASRARRRLRDEDSEADRLRQAKLVDAFLAAARDGEFERLLALLDPEIVLTADPAAARIGVAEELHGADAVAEFARYARGATPALLDGDAAIVWVVGGAPRVVYRFSTDGERITGIELIGDPDRVRALDLLISR
jgi:RNA polymerase sigma-70 factor (ECF subfamily)